METIEELQGALINCYHDAAQKIDAIYNAETAEAAIRSSSAATFKILDRMDDESIVAFVRKIAASVPDDACAE